MATQINLSMQKNQNIFYDIKCINDTKLKLKKYS